MIEKIKKPVKVTFSNGKVYEIISIQEAARRADTSSSSISYQCVDHGEGSVLDICFPLSHDKSNSGVKCIVVNGKWRIQVKCDYDAGPGGTGNLFLQTAECNPLKQI